MSGQSALPSTEGLASGLWTARTPDDQALSCTTRKSPQVRNRNHIEQRGVETARS
jgi:hypothetical protein